MSTAPEWVPWKHWDMAMAIVLVILGTLLAGFIAVVVADSMVAPGQGYEENATAYTVVLASSFIAQELLLLGAAAWFGPRKYRVSWAVLGLRKPVRGTWWLPLAMGIAGLVIAHGYVAVLSLIGVDPGADTPHEVFDNAGPFLVVAVGAVLMAPFMEEVFFRGFIFGGLRQRRGWVLAAVLSSLLFALAHLSLYVVPPFAAIGFLLAWSYQYQGSIRPAIIAHTIINVFSLGLSFAALG